MNKALESYLAQYRQRINQRLFTLLDASQTLPECAKPHITQLQEACAYSVQNGGKRIRPVLAYAAAHAIDAAFISDGLDYLAASLELIHCYSLVHDDLPAMDDDDLRRGKPSCHRAYDEASAILAGDGLQARAFELAATAPQLSSEQRIEAISILAHAAGNSGMVGGQAMDINATNKALNTDELTTMHRLKTGALINAAIQLGAIAAAANNSQRQSLQHYGDAVGLAFQIADDILDVQGDTATLGKTGGKDAINNKPTYVQLLGVDGAKQAATEQLDKALTALYEFGESANPLRDLARFIIHREN